PGMWGLVRGPHVRARLPAVCIRHSITCRPHRTLINNSLYYYPKLKLSAAPSLVIRGISIRMSKANDRSEGSRDRGNGGNDFPASLNICIINWSSSVDPEERNNCRSLTEPFSFR